MGEKVSFDVILLHARESMMSDDIKNQLVSALGSYSVQTIAKMDKIDLIRQLAVIFPDPEYNNNFRHNVADAIQKILKDYHIQAEPLVSHRPRFNPFRRFKREPHDYELLLRQMSIREYNHHQGMGASLTGGIFDQLRVSGTGFFLKNPIVLESGIVKGMDTRGTILVPPGVKIEVTGTSSQVKVKLCSWEELFKKAGLDLTTENDKHYQDLLQQASKGTYNHRGMDASLSGGIFNQLSVSGTGFVLKNPIVLKSLSVEGMSTRTKILASPKITIAVKGTDSQVKVKLCSWKELARRAHLI